MKRHANDGVRKLCECARNKWASCKHPWHFSFKWNDTHHRFSLDKHLDKHIEDKSEAKDEAAKIRIAIKAGTFGVAAPVAETFTLGQLLDTYKKRYVDVERTDSTVERRLSDWHDQEDRDRRPDGRSQPFGDWLV